MNTVMITGGAGFIGSHLVERLIHDGYRVVCVDNFFTGTMDNLSSVVGNANLILEHRSITDNDIIIEYKKLYPELI